jgi:hypothetical protein
VSPVRAIPTSRAYWELRAEQVLNRVFSPEAPIDVEVCETPPTTTPAGPRAGQRPASRRPPAPSRQAPPSLWWRQLQQQPTVLLAGLSLLVTLTAGTTLLGLSLWQQSQQAIRQERNLLLVERLRSMGPAAAPAPEASGAAEAQAPEAQAGGDDQLPPPPLEPWMEELASLPASTAPAANVLKVPMSNRVASPAPPASGRSTGAGPSAPAMAPAADPANLPQLVGVVQVPGQPGSAIFQVEGSSSSAASGEAIGNSGWRLQSASGDSAVIERNGVQQRISISSGF